MDIECLIADELDIECEIRSIQGGDHEYMARQLKAQIDLESRTHSLKPKKPHEAAYKNPRRESKICGAKLIEFHEFLKSQSHKDVNVDELNKLVSRLIHVQDRLFRLKYSKCVQKEVQKLLVDSGQLIEIVKVVLSKSNEELEETIGSLNNMSISVPSDEEIEEEDIHIQPVQQYNDNNVKTKNAITHGNQISNKLKTHHEEQLHHSEVLQTLVEDVAKPVNLYEHLGAAPQASTSQNKEQLKQLLASQDLDLVIDLLNDCVMSKTTLLSTQELRFEKLCEMVTPPTRNNRSSYVPSKPNSESQFFSNLSQPTRKLGPNYVDFSYPSSRPNSEQILQSKSNQNFPQYNAAPSNNGPFQYYVAERPTFLKRDPSTWGLTFHGNSRDPPVENFIFRIESIATGVFNVNLDSLVNEFCTFLRDEAQSWYWSYMQRNTGKRITYTQFRVDFMARFRDMRSDFDIKCSLSNRKQNYRDKEEFRKYFDAMMAISARLAKTIPDDELLEIIKRNMRPGLQIALINHNFSNLDELLLQCVSLESMWTRLGYNPEAFVLNRRSVEEVFIESTDEQLVLNKAEHNLSALNIQKQINAPRSFQLKNSNPPVTDGKYSNSYSMPASFKSDPNLLTICFNCDDIGHHFKDCQVQEKRVFCYRCGNLGFYLPQCPNCKKWYLNYHQRTSTHGTTYPQNQSSVPQIQSNQPTNPKHFLENKKM